jgi:hypothetical protein
MNRDPSPAMQTADVYSSAELIETTNLTLDACIEQCREEISKSLARRREFLSRSQWEEDHKFSDYQYGLQTAIEIIEKVKREGP